MQRNVSSPGVPNEIILVRQVSEDFSDSTSKPAVDEGVGLMPLVHDNLPVHCKRDPTLFAKGFDVSCHFYKVPFATSILCFI